MSGKIFLKCFLFGILGAALLLCLALFPSCKSTEQAAVDEQKIAAPEEPVVTYVNTAVNKADGKISTVMLFNSIKEVVAIHPISRVRYNLSEADFKYDSDTTELKVVLPKNIPYKLNDLAFHIVGEAVYPGVFVWPESTRDAESLAFLLKEKILWKEAIILTTKVPPE